MCSGDDRRAVTTVPGYQGDEPGRALHPHQLSPVRRLVILSTPSDPS